MTTHHEERQQAGVKHDKQHICMLCCSSLMKAQVIMHFAHGQLGHSSQTIIVIWDMVIWPAAPHTPQISFILQHYIRWMQFKSRSWDYALHWAKHTAFGISLVDMTASSDLICSTQCPPILCMALNCHTFNAWHENACYLSWARMDNICYMQLTQVSAHTFRHEHSDFGNSSQRPQSTSGNVLNI